ncbi:hypothetical protein ACFL27_06355 [candidate division CSSED10-310 bacterium]|uniref:Zinc-finger domain-containing protein n=1 Tax=candidate division CSSED10-310 bacterium TaxID=2855610 RepID=A0ABV6YUE9_UNCC1
MISHLCQEFQDWLERLPRRDLSPAFTRHLTECEHCRQRLEHFEDVATSLMTLEAPQPLPESTLAAFTNITLDEVRRHTTRRLITKLTMVGLLCLPLVIIVNWFWAALGYNLLVVYISPSLAQIYLVLFILTASGLSGLSYGAIPLIAGYLRGHSVKEGE